ncbi:PucR family transcriptional regulator [Halalkalibacter akibai]|uniref:Fis-type helix-turn-helix domain protein n=1 Tax=Halalkalibacter akibai (strain ATCC 43226 / DSM 21942 / CIP 109018 / JCM 9157 / 1139) TaxID=1236973 RepID=W4QT54_HALA3|nr:helix-turn-helix domain-containing protein [Halalkalibacter akibai]GAE35281.1 Fis-type helix-turn-helix domain protein [Halalkalibacter akibai JCM 9157]
MLEKLKEHFGNKIVVHSSEFEFKKEDYYWFKTPEQITVGFPNEQLTDDEISLLNLFLSPITFHNSFELTSNEEKYWSSILFDTEYNSNDSKNLSDHFRFTHLKIKGEVSEPDSLVEAIKSLYPTKTIILWVTGSEAVIIDLEPTITDQIDNLHEAIADTIASDFYIDLSLYIGLKSTSIQEARERYDWEKDCFDKIRQSFKKKIYIGEEMIPHLLLYEANSINLNQISKQLLHNVKDDKDLIKSIRVYLDCNMNISLAAKKLYLHRNTLQYRVEKFIEKTGVDIRHFNNAVSIYLALLFNDSSK